MRLHFSDHQVSFTGRVAFDEALAVTEIGSLLYHLWAGALAPARHYLFSVLPSILSYATDGTYARAMQSEEDMLSFIDGLVGSSRLRTWLGRPTKTQKRTVVPAQETVKMPTP